MRGFFPILIGLFLLGVSNMSRAEKNHNPLNIRENERSNYDWEGEAATDIDSEMEEFISDEYGFRAGTRILMTYDRKYGVNTINDIIYKWAPPEDKNDTEGYIAFVVKKTGLHRNKILNPITDYLPVMQAMANMETGKIYPLSVIMTGMSLA